MLKLLFKKTKSTERKIQIFTYTLVLSLLALLIVAVYKNNREFVYYNTILIFLVVFVFVLRKSLNLTFPLLFLIWILFILHALGGIIEINGTRLYDCVFILKYDNYVHFYGSLVAVFLAYNLINPSLNIKHRHSKFFLLLVLTFISMGIGTIVEIIELIAVVFFNGARGVGDYMNNAVDLLFNMLGALTGAIIIIIYKNKQFIKRFFNENLEE